VTRSVLAFIVAGWLMVASMAPAYCTSGDQPQDAFQQARLEMVDAQPGDVLDTWADCSDLERDFAYRPDTPLAKGISNFTQWFREYYRS